MSFCLFDGTGDVATSDLTTAVIGDLDVRIKVRVSDWTTAILSLINQWAGNWLFGLTAEGGLLFYFIDSGSTFRSAVSTAVVPAVDNVTDIWVRVTHDADNGAASTDTVFYTSADGTTWTKLGDTVTVGAAGNRPGTVNAHKIDCQIAARIYSAEIRSGIDGTIVANPAFDAAPWDKGETVNDDTSSTTNTWTLTGAIISADAWTLTGAAVSAATVAAGLKLGHPLAGASVIDAATVAGSLKLSRQLAGATSSSSTVVSALKLGHQLAGASLDVSTVSSALKLGHTLAGAATSTTIVDASLKLLHQLVGAVTGSASVAGSLDLHLIHLLLGAATSNSAAAGALKLLHQLYGNPALTSQVAARLTVYGNIGSATIAETLQGLATIVETGPN